MNIPNNRIQAETKGRAQQNTSERLSQVQSEIEELEKTAFQLSECLDRLQIRVQSVYLARPSDVTKNESPEPEPVPLAGKIRALRRNIQQSSARVAEMVEGIEL